MNITARRTSAPPPPREFVVTMTFSEEEARCVRATFLNASRADVEAVFRQALTDALFHLPESGEGDVVRTARITMNEIGSQLNGLFEANS